MVYRPYPEMREYVEKRIHYQARRLRRFQQEVPGKLRDDIYYYEKGILDTLYEIHETMVPDHEKVYAEL